MKVHRKDGGPERRVVTAMVVHETVLGRVCGRWTKGGLFKSEWANTVGQWCVDYYTKYKKAPGRNITPLFEAWADDNKDTETVTLVERFLGQISDEFSRLKKEINPDHIIDTAGELFNRVAAEKLIAQMEGDLERGEVEKALQRRDKFGRIELGKGEWVDPFRDQSVVDQAFEEKGEPLIRFKGPLQALGDFFADSLERDGLVALMAPEKRGKTWVLQELAFAAMKQGRRVAFFQVGDLSRNQIMRRLMIRAAGRPMKACEVRIPTTLDVDEEAGVTIMHDCKTYEDAMTREEAWRACQKVVKKEKDCLMRLAVYPNTFISAAGIDNVIDRWAVDGWEPDVIVVDYADILAPMVAGAAESRDQINLTWKYLRRISQERHCLVLTATQTDADSYDTDLIRRRNFSEDKRKFAHVTGMFAINQIDSEKRNGIMRLNWTVLREGEFFEGQQVYVAGCLGVANPFIRSCMPPMDFVETRRNRPRRDGENG